MSKRNRREHGRIISVETLYRGDSLADDVAAGATSITVNDAGDFDEDGGWLLVGAQTVEYTACDDDTGVIDLADPLAAAGEQGDPVQVWSDLYDEPVDYQLALVELDGEYDNPDPVVAEVAEGVGDLPEGDRGKAGESCTLHRVAEDEWEVVGVGGRPRSASVSASGLRFEQDDSYALTAADITAASATLPLSHRPVSEGLTCYLAGVPQRPTNWTIDYNTQTLTIPLSGWEKAGYVLWAHYAYIKGVVTAQVPEPTIFEMGCTATASGDVEGQAASFASYTITGTQPVWSDDSDASYITFTGRWGLSVANDLAFARAILDKPACLSASDSVRVAVVWRQSNAPYAADDLVVGLSRDPGSSYSATGVSENTDLVAPAGWRIAELSPYVSWSSAIADWLAARAYVGFYNNFNGRTASEPADPTYESHTISEVRVVVIPT